MEKIPRDMLKILAETGTKTIPGDRESFNLYMEWVKWLSYTPDFEKKRINTLKSKKNKTTEEFKEVGNFYYFKRMDNLFNKYGTINMDVDEYEEVLLFMEQMDIEDYMKSKLTKEELDKANNLIKEYKDSLDEVLFDKVYSERKEENYKGLSMVDSYVLHYLDKVVQVRNSISFQNMIKHQMDENAYMSHKSMINTLKPNKNN